MQQPPHPPTEPPPVGYARQPAAPDQSARNLGMACHLLGLVGFLGPLILWLIKKGEHPFIDDQGREALNFQLSILIYTLACIPLVFVLIGIPLAFAVSIFDLVMIIIAAIKANEGQCYRYPLCIRMIS